MSGRGTAGGGAGRGSAGGGPGRGTAGSAPSRCMACSAPGRGLAGHAGAYCRAVDAPLARRPARRGSIRRAQAVTAIERETSASKQLSASPTRPRGRTGTGAADALPPPKCVVTAAPALAPGSVVSVPAAGSAAGASTVPHPTLSAAPPGGRFCALAVIARTTRSGASRGYLALISAATPAVSAQAGLVPLTSQSCPSLPCAGTSTPGAPTCTDRLSLETLAAAPLCETAATPSTPG